MAYIGNTPGENFISFSKQVFTIVNSQTAYSLDHKVTDENELRLVINNVVQEPGTGKAYTASGNTLTLASALTNGTDEMYCIFLGKARETSTVPDSFITKNKLNLISTSSSAGLEVKGDGSSQDGYLQLNCSQNSHGVKIKSPPHSAGQSYTLTLPSSISADTFLKTDSSGNLSFAAAGGITEVDSFRLTSNQSISSGTQTTLTPFARDNESTFSKIGTGMSESSGIFTMGATGIYLLIANFYLRINGDLTYASLKIQGTTNNSTYYNMAYNDQSIKQVVGNTYHANTTHAIFDCQDTSTHKFRLRVYGTHTFDCLGSASDSHTYITAIRLGDT